MKFRTTWMSTGALGLQCFSSVENFFKVTDALSNLNLDIAKMPSPGKLDTPLRGEMYKTKNTAAPYASE